MVQQEYIIGEQFQLSNQAQLSVEDTVWNWERRTLSGFIDKDGNFIQPGGSITLDDPEAEVSGIWTMDKGRPFGLCCLGQTGGISVTFTISSTEAPLADAAHPFISSVTLTSSRSFDTYKWTDISASIEVAPETRILSLSAYQWSASDHIAIFKLSNNLSNVLSPFKRAGQYWDTFNYPFVISVDFTNHGILEYVPNTGIYIPTPDNPL